MRGKELHATNIYESGIAIQLLDNSFFPFWLLFFSSSFTFLGLLNLFCIVFLCLFELHTLILIYLTPCLLQGMLSLPM